jgi:phospholipid/cholesterol/gamma-HCH transport system substrate-binding protein
VIGSGKSGIDVLLSNLPNLTTHMIELVERFNLVFSDENVQAFKATLNNAKMASEQLPPALRDLHEMLADARRAAQEVHGTVTDLHAVVQHATPDVEMAVANIRQVAETLAKTAERLDGFVRDNEPGLSRFTRQSLPEFEQLLRESRQAARDFRDLSRSLKQNPSQLIYESNYRGVQVPQ